MSKYKEPGWITHYVFNEKFTNPHMNNFINIHTHGLYSKYKHPNIQIIMKLPPHMAHTIIYNTVDEIESGVIIKAGDFNSNILNGYKVSFINAYEHNREVLRMLLPSKNGRLEGDYSNQIMDCLNINSEEIINKVLESNYSN